MLNICDCCGKSKSTNWYLLDDNMEQELCGKCAKELRSEMEVELID